MLQSDPPGLYLVFYQMNQCCRAEAHWLDTLSGVVLGSAKVGSISVLIGSEVQ